jgi:hypothetical protein
MSKETNVSNFKQPVRDYKDGFIQKTDTVQPNDLNKMFTSRSYQAILYDKDLSLLFKSFCCFYVFGLRNIRQMVNLRKYPDREPWSFNCNSFWIPYMWFYQRLRDPEMIGAVDYIHIEDIWKSHLSMWSKLFFKSKFKIPS